MATKLPGSTVKMIGKSHHLPRAAEREGSSKYAGKAAFRRVHHDETDSESARLATRTHSFSNANR